MSHGKKGVWPWTGCCPRPERLLSLYIVVAITSSFKVFENLASTASCCQSSKLMLIVDEGVEFPQLIGIDFL